MRTFPTGIVRYNSPDGRQFNAIVCGPALDEAKKIYLLRAETPAGREEVKAVLIADSAEPTEGEATFQTHPSDER